MNISNRLSLNIVSAAATAAIAFATASTAQAATPAGLPAAIAPSAKWIVHNLSSVHKSASRALSNANATIYPLDGPFGLTVAPNGDLYVANFRGNNVLVYGSNLVQKPAYDFSAGLTYPTGVAFDSTGEVFVSNVSPSAVNVYSAAHTLLPSRTITALVNYPMSVTIDGLDNLYVDNNTASLAVYSYGGLFIGSVGNSFLQIPYAAMAQHGHLSAFAGNGAMIYTATNAALDDAQNPSAPTNAYVATGVAFKSPRGIAFDANENLYVATSDPAIYYLNTTTHQGQLVVPLGFAPQAVAVDSVHNHLFVADFTDNAIMVYTLAGQFITTMH